MNEACELIHDHGFLLHNDFNLNIGQKFHYRCKNVPADQRPWCDRKYTLFMPSDRPIYIVQHNNMEHNCHELTKKTRKKMSEELQNRILNLFELGTIQPKTVLAHVEREIKEGKFPHDRMPTVRQIRYHLQKFKDSKVKPLFKLGDLMSWCVVSN